MGFKSILGDRKFNDAAIYKHKTRGDTISKHMQENQERLNGRTYYISSAGMPHNLFDLKLNVSDRIIVSTPVSQKNLTLVVVE